MLDPPVKVSLGIEGFEHETEENLKWRKFNTEIIDLRPMKLNIKQRKTLNQGILNKVSTVFLLHIP
jgi:hypothetical protein